MPPKPMIAERNGAAARQAADDAFRLIENRFRVLADGCPGALVIYDAQRRFVFVNERVVEWSDRPLSDWVGRCDEEVFPPDLIAAYLPTLERALATGTPQSVECPINYCGESVYVVIQYIPSLDDAGNVREVLAVARDVTYQRRVERELLRRDQELRSLADNVPDIIVRFDREGRHLYINRQIEAVTGLPVEAFIGKTNAELSMPAELVAQWDAELQHALATGISVESQFEWDSPSGSRHFEVRLLPEQRSDGRIETVLAIVRDITDRQRVMSQLSDSEERFRMAFAAAPIGIALMSRDGTLLEVNLALCDMLGYAEDELTGMKLADITHDDDIPLNMAHNEAAFADGAGPTTLDTRHRTKQGRIVWGRVTSTVLRDAAGVALYSIRMIQDITESQRTREVLERYQGHLEELVRSRTRALEASQESLRSAERLASLGTLAAGIAHEINNPVGTILLAAEMALAAETSGDRETLTRCLDAIKNDAQRCGRIVKNVLSFARQQPTDKTPCHLNEIVRQAIERTSDYAARRQATIAADLHPGTGRVFMNPVAIEQALVNILRNAVETRAGVAVSVTTGRVKEGYAVTIVDDGPGMSAEVQRHIFDPFFTMRRADGGTGLGLSLVHGTISDHRGSISVDSKPGAGTTFLIEFPRYDG